jgi:hypothetical protein
MRKRFAIALGVAAAGALALGAQGAAAATIEVTDTSDSGVGSLRKAIARANRLPGPDRIVITATGTISLVSSLPDLSTGLAIDGPGAGRLTIDGHGLPRSTFRVYPGVTVTLSNISIVGGGASGINNSGKLTLSQSAVRDAHRVGIANLGDATLTDSVVLHNGNGGIKNYEGTLTVLRSTVAHNTGVGPESGRLRRRGRLDHRPRQHRQRQPRPRLPHQRGRHLCQPWDPHRLAQHAERQLRIQGRGDRGQQWCSDHRAG